MALAQLMPSPCPEPPPWGRIVEGGLCVWKEVGGINGGVCGDVACEGQTERRKAHPPAHQAIVQIPPHTMAHPLWLMPALCVCGMGRPGSD